MYILVTFSFNKFLKLSQLVKTVLTEVNDTKSGAKFLHIAFSLVFMGIF